jgi:uncharacterized protein YutE (UPF0331/DUF86 family)/predicted nucleotidyltransferase
MQTAEIAERRRRAETPFFSGGTAAGSGGVPKSTGHGRAPAAGRYREQSGHPGCHGLARAVLRNRIAGQPQFDPFHVGSTEHELDLLEHMAKRVDAIHQHDLARIAGLSLGIANAIGERPVHKGWLTIRKVNSRTGQLPAEASETIRSLQARRADADYSDHTQIGRQRLPTASSSSAVVRWTTCRQSATLDHDRCEADSMKGVEQLVVPLRALLEREPEVALAFLFGSHAIGRATSDSDIDVAVYLRHPEQEDRIWAEVGKACGADVDLVLLSVKDPALYWRLYLEASREAEDFADFTSEYVAIARRSRSTSPEDRVRLARRLEFLREEWRDLQRFFGVTFDEYRGSKSLRRELERWVENIVNATIDIAKIVLASKKKTLPQSYQDALREFAALAGLSAAEAEQFSTIARLRNLLAHEDLDLLYDRIRKFLDSFPHAYNDRVFEFLKAFLREP